MNATELRGALSKIRAGGTAGRPRSNRSRRAVVPPVSLVLKFYGMPDDYILHFALQPSEVTLFRCNGKGRVIPVQLDELSVEAVAKAIWDDSL